jgi:hypothetical protein
MPSADDTNTLKSIVNTDNMQMFASLRYRAIALSKLPGDDAMQLCMSLPQGGRGARLPNARG